MIRLALLPTSSPTAKLHGLWVLHRRNALTPGFLRDFSKDESPLVRTHLQRILAERPTWDADTRELVFGALADADAFVQRAAVEGLAAHPAPEDVIPLLALRAKAPAKDTHLLHAVRMALRDQFRHPITAESIALKAWSEAEAAALADVCPGVHNTAAATYLSGYLTTRPEEASRRRDYLHTIVRFGENRQRELAVQSVRDHFGKDPALQASLLKTVVQAIQERGAKIDPAERAFAATLIEQLLKASPAAQVQEGIELAQTMKMKDAVDPLLVLVRSKSIPSLQRKNAIQALITIDAAKSEKTLAAVLLDDKENLAVREQVAQALASLNQPKTHDVLIGALTKAPAPLQTTIALGMAGSPQGGEKLLEAVTAGKASPRLLQERGVVLKLEQARVRGLNERLATLTKGLPAADQRIGELINLRRTSYLAAKSDPLAGRKIFEKNCAACHQIANQGSKIGPQLDGVGIRGIDRLLEDILDPNRNVDQAFRSTTLALDNGQFMTGLVLREEGQVIVLADAQGKEIRVAKSNVQERSVGPLSPMPANFGEQIVEADFNHLLAYLLSQRVKE